MLNGDTIPDRCKLNKLSAPCSSVSPGTDNDVVLLGEINEEVVSEIMAVSVGLVCMASA